MTYVDLFYFSSTENIYIWFLLLLTKWSKRATNSKKPNVIFFCFTECKYVAYLLNQDRQLANGRNVYGAIFC